MRLAEEKTLMLLEAIALLFILLASIGYDITNEKINERQVKISLLDNSANNILIDLLDTGQQLNFFTILDGLNVNIKDVDVGYKNKYERNTLVKIRENFKNHKITTKEYLNDMEDDYLKSATCGADNYNNLVIKIRKLISDKMILLNWVKQICNWVRISAIIISTFLYLCIYRTISKRDLK